MKSFIAILSILLLFVSPAFSGNDGKESIIEAVVNRWNDAHNKKDINAFYRIFGSTVQFYGKQQKRLDCVTQKSKGLLKKKYIQQIITPLKIAYYNSGIVKVSFKQMVTTPKHVNVYLAYLLLEETNGNYIVVGESDLETDQNLGYVLNIGEEIQQTEYSNKIIFLVGGLILIGGGSLYLVNRRKNLRKSVSPTLPPTPVGRDPKYAFQRTINELYSASQLTEEEKGNAFEKWIVERFDKKYFDLLEWRSDKIHADRYALSSMNPDLEFRFKGKKVVEFAVECKWRKGLFDQKIQWAKDYQVRNYRAFESRTNKKVFIILGVGGEPHNPENLYVIPLELIHSTHLERGELANYRKNNKTSFYFNPFKMELS